jgi:hypothetical protein
MRDPIDLDVALAALGERDVDLRRARVRRHGVERGRARHARVVVLEYAQVVGVEVVTDGDHHAIHGQARIAGAEVDLDVVVGSGPREAHHLAALVEHECLK